MQQAAITVSINELILDSYAGVCFARTEPDLGDSGLQGASRHLQTSVPEVMSDAVDLDCMVSFVEQQGIAIRVA